MSDLLISLPAEVILKCNGCEGQYKLASVSLSGRQVLLCPYCGGEMDLYESLEPAIRRQIYHAIRDAVEQRVHEETRMASNSYFEDEANLGRN